MLDKVGVVCFGFVLILVSFLIVLGCNTTTNEPKQEDQQAVEDEQVLETTLHVFRTSVQTIRTLYH